jgi:hypothetical protein
MSHTYAVLELSPAAYDEIARKLKEAGYDQAFDVYNMRGGEPVIDMHGIGVARAEAPAATS